MNWSSKNKRCENSKNTNKNREKKKRYPPGWNEHKNKNRNCSPRNMSIWADRNENENKSINRLNKTAWLKKSLILQLKRKKESVHQRNKLVETLKIQIKRRKR